MGAGRLAVVLVILAIFFVGGAAAISESLTGAGPTTDITDEEFEPVGNETISLQFSNLNHTTYSETVTVTDNQDTVFPSAGNYTWNENNGTIFVENESALANENAAFIDYNYTEPIDEAITYANIYSKLADNAQPGLLLVVAVAVVLAGVGVFGRSF